MSNRFRGTCYRAANWIEVGVTQGFGRVRGGAVGYRRRGLPNHVFLYALRQLAAFAHLAVSILRLLGTTNIGRRMGNLHVNPDAAVGLLCG